MTFRYPFYYKNFNCIAGVCEDTCCAGWEIDIDDKSYEYYMSVEGEFGDKLRSLIKEYEDSDDEDVYERHGFVLTKDGRCPFLNSENLCDMYIALGEQALCDVCTNTPRNILEYGEERELSISVSCPEAGRLALLNSEKVTFCEEEIDEKLGFEEDEEEIEFAKAIRAARDRSIEILQNRSIDIRKRVAIFLNYGELIQDCINENDIDKIYEIEPTEISLSDKNIKKRYENFLQRVNSYINLESISERWEKMLAVLSEQLIENGNENDYEKKSNDFFEYMKQNEKIYEYEQLLAYYAFLMLGRCVDDYDFLGKVKFCVVSYMMIKDFDVAYFAKNGYSFEDKDMVFVAGVYAKEVEHSQNNLDYLADDFIFEQVYNLDNMLISV